MSGAARIMSLAAAGAVVAAAGLVAGAWWLTFPVAVAAGVVAGRTRTGLLAGGLAGFFGWALPLVWLAASADAGPASAAIAAIMGFTGAAALPVIITCAVGTLLGLTGGWLGAAARGAFVARGA